MRKDSLLFEHQRRNLELPLRRPFRYGHGSKSRREEGMRPKPKGRLHKNPYAPMREEAEQERLHSRERVRVVRTKLAYLDNLKALIVPGQQ